MSDNCREVLRDAVVLIATLTLGLMTAWIVLKLQKPEPAAGPLERVLHTQP